MRSGRAAAPASSESATEGFDLHADITVGADDREGL